MHERPRAHACVLVSPNYPDADGEEAALIKRLIRFVLTTPVEIGAPLLADGSTEQDTEATPEKAKDGTDNVVALDAFRKE